MAYDEHLAAVVRAELSDVADVAERKMFGGLAFLIGGNMSVVVSGQGGLMIRLDPETAEDLVATTPAYPAEMRGRTMRGWLRVDEAAELSGPALTDWVHQARMFNATLPPK